MKKKKMGLKSDVQNQNFWFMWFMKYIFPRSKCAPPKPLPNTNLQKVT